MGNFSSKDGHGPSGPHLDIFHTPPTSPVTDVPAVPQLIPPSAELADTLTLTPTPVTASVPASVPVPTGKKPQPGTTPVTPTTPSPPPDWKPTPPVTPNNTVIGPAVSLLQNKPGSGLVALKGPLGLNGGPSCSTPKTPLSQGNSVELSPIKSPSSLGSASPVASPAGPSWRERDSGLSQSPLQSHGARDSQGEEMEKLVEECETTLGITAQDGAVGTTDLLKHLLTEVKNLRSTLQTERGEWLQFQADLQVAVAVADRLRAEAEEELTALRSAHKDVERELVVTQQRQKEADGQLVTLRGELRESRQRQATLAQAQGKIEVQAPYQAQDGPGAETNSSDLQEKTQRGRERGMERVSQNEEMRNVATEEARTDSKGVAKRYLRNVTNEERRGEDRRTNETARRIVTTERSRSLSRLPVSSDPPTIQNGTSQSNTATSAASINKNPSQPQGRRSLDRQDSWSSTQTGKQEETLNKYNAALTELPPSKSQDGFNLLLRRHGGSKRNSLLRWCQSRTQGYKNIDITNFSSSWADGLAFCAVYHTYLPSHIPYCTLSPESKRENLSLAFKTGENVGITQSLTLEEMLRAGGPDWQRVLGYVESMYRHFEM